jgi:hypothetical protein
MSNNQTYNDLTLREGITSLMAQHPALHLAALGDVDVVVELADGSHPQPGDLLNIKAVKFDTRTGMIHLVVEEMYE